MNLSTDIAVPCVAHAGPSFGTLQADVEAWKTGFVNHVREELGDDAAEATERDFAGDPWLALRWYVEDSHVVANPVVSGEPTEGA